MAKKKKTDEELDAELLALFEEAESEVNEEAHAKEGAKEAAAPTVSKLEKATPGKNVLGTEKATAVPTGKGSKVSPALQRFAFNTKDKPK